MTLGQEFLQTLWTSCRCCGPDKSACGCHMCAVGAWFCGKVGLGLSALLLGDIDVFVPFLASLEGHAVNRHVGIGHRHCEGSGLFWPLCFWQPSAWGAGVFCVKWFWVRPCFHYRFFLASKSFDMQEATEIDSWAYEQCQASFGAICSHQAACACACTPCTQEVIASQVEQEKSH